MSVQNSCRSLRVATGGRPGDRNGGRPHRSDRRFFLSIATFSIEVLRRPLESAQYVSMAYCRRLADHGLEGSMSRRGNPYDNAKAESFMKTLKVEEVYVADYRKYADVVERLPRFIDDIYNSQRLHSALGYWSPVQFEFNNARQPVLIQP